MMVKDFAKIVALIHILDFNCCAKRDDFRKSSYIRQLKSVRLVGSEVHYSKHAIRYKGAHLLRLLKKKSCIGL